MFFTLTLNPVLDRTLTVPSLEFNEVLRAENSRTDIGGKGFNVSRALKKQGADNTALGFLGGTIGAKLEKGLIDLGISTDFTPIAGETRTNTVVIETRGEKYIKVNEPGPTIQESDRDALLAKVARLARPADTWILSGSLPPGLPAGFYAELIRLLKIHQAQVFFDASGEPFRQGLLATPDLIKPNLEEAGQVLGCVLSSQADILTALHSFLNMGIKTVALSAGADGLWLASGATCVHAVPPKIVFHNPVGIGDSLLAGLAIAFHQGRSLEEAARWATACGTTAAQFTGVTFGTHAEIETVYRQVSTQFIPL